MKFAILGGKTILDIIFLNSLSDQYPDLDIECYGDSGKISYGEKVLSIQSIEKFNAQNFDIIINLSKNYDKYHELIKKSGKLYFNYFESYEKKCILLPDFACIPLKYFMEVFSENLVDLDIINIKCIGELGKEEFNRFHREVQNSHFNILDDNKKKNPLAFSVNLDCLEEEIMEFKELVCEKNITSYLYNINSKLNLTVNALVAPVNKSSLLILNFVLTKDMNLNLVKKHLEKAGFIYSLNPISSVLIENDDQLYFSKLRVNGNKYSVSLVYDSLYVFINWLISCLEVSLAIV